MEHSIENKVTSLQPGDITGKHIAKAIRALGPHIKAAQEKLKSIPLKEILDPITFEPKLVRMATAEELQRILNDTCFGKVVADTMPIMMNNTPSVVAYVSVATDEGFYRLPGSFASQTVDVVSGEKSLLWAESRAIRRALRSIGLRAETDFFDAQESDMEVKASKLVDEQKNEKSSKKSKPESSSKSKAKKTTNSKSAAKPKASKKSKAEPKSSDASKDKLKIGDNPISVKVSRDAPGFPNRKSSTYYTQLLGGLKQARLDIGVNVESFVRHVFGKGSFEGRRITLQSLTSDELEVLFQYYVLDRESEI